MPCDLGKLAGRLRPKGRYNFFLLVNSVQWKVIKNYNHFFFFLNEPHPFFIKPFRPYTEPPVHFFVYFFGNLP